jgi:pimeloyl-ACP methyl ester carboxylesterase
LNDDRKIERSSQDHSEDHSENLTYRRYLSVAFFDSNGVKIHYEDQGSGGPVILVHGFASKAEHNWGMTGWYKTLTPHYRVIALDCRGHGQSDKPHDLAAYSGRAMEDDVIRLMDHLGIKRALLMGYSMGARISMGLLAHHPSRFRAVVLGGIGAGAGVTDTPSRDGIVQALLSEDKAQVKEPRGKLFREFAEANRNDLKALAACMGAERELVNSNEFTSNSVPVLVVAGTKDDLVGEPEDLANMIPMAQLLKLEGRDHLNAPGDKRYHHAVSGFFAAAPQ